MPKIKINMLLIIDDSKDSREIPNMKVLRAHLKAEGHLKKSKLNELITKVTNIMSMFTSKFISQFIDFSIFNLENEPNIVCVTSPTIIVGDIHGQFYDLINMFEKVIDC